MLMEYEQPREMVVSLMNVIVRFGIQIFNRSSTISLAFKFEPLKSHSWFRYWSWYLCFFYPFRTFSVSNVLHEMLWSSLLIDCFSRLQALDIQCINTWGALVPYPSFIPRQSIALGGFLTSAGYEERLQHMEKIMFFLFKIHAYKIGKYR